MKPAIQKILKQTPAQYDNMVLSMWLRWCGEKTNNERSLQKALCNRALFNWWKAELGMYEIEFLQATEPYVDVLDARKAKELYADTIIPIFDYFPRPLLKAAQKQQ